MATHIYKIVASLFSILRLRTSLPKLEVKSPSFKHSLHFLHGKSFSFRYKNDDKDDGSNGDEDEDHEVPPADFLNGEWRDLHQHDYECVHRRPADRDSSGSDVRW